MASIWFDQRGATQIACFTLCIGASRRQVKKSLGTSDRKLARRLADELEEAAQGRRTREQIRSLLDGIADLRSRRVSWKAFDWALRSATGQGLDSKTTRSFIEGWLERTKGEVAPATWARYRQVSTALLQSLGPQRADADIATVKAEDLVRFRDSEAKRVAPRTANVNLKIARVIFNAAEADGAVGRNEARFVKLLRVRDEERRRPFTLEEIQLLLGKADAEWRSLILFGFYTGARLSDLAGLTWENLDLERSELRLVAKKTGRRVIIPLAKPLRGHIDGLTAGDDPRAPIHPRAFEILKKEGRVGTLSRQFGELLASAGLAKSRSHEATGEGHARRRTASELSFHALRHTFVTALKASGAAEAVAMDLAGHESAEISRHYTSIDGATKRNALDKLPVIG